MRIVSFNVNGLRALDKKTGNDFNSFCLTQLKADILCLQEIKGSESSLSKYHSLKDYQTFSTFHKNGRHGVSTLVRKTLFCEKSEEIAFGRILKTYHGNFVIYNCYMPYYDESKEGDKTEIIKVYDSLLQCLDSRRVVICGDMNATYNVLDHYQFSEELETLMVIKEWMPHDKLVVQYEIGDGKETTKMLDKKKLWKAIEETAEEFLDYDQLKEKVEKINPRREELAFHFFTIKALEEYFFDVYQRAWMKTLAASYVDTFRLFNKELTQYTCWNVLMNMRAVNLGTRIDYVLCSDDIECASSGIMPEIKGSDHCPVFADFNLEVFEDEKRNLAKKKNNLLAFFKKD
ncbi:hypothetical protein GINT2_000716 [Glugoides intestinalis]